MNCTLTSYDVESELKVYDTALDMGIIDWDIWEQLVARFLLTFGDF